MKRQTDGSVVAGWQALLDSAVDSSAWKDLPMMPAACRTYKVAGSRLRLGAGELGELTSRQSFNNPTCTELHRKSTHLPSLISGLPQQPQELLLGFLNSMIDAQVRAVMGVHPLSGAQSPVREWLQAFRLNLTLSTEPAGVERLEAALSAWTAPLQYQMTGQSLFRTCFLLPLLHQAKPIGLWLPTGS